MKGRKAGEEREVKTDKRKDRQMEGLKAGRTDKEGLWMEGRNDGEKEGRMDGRRDRQKARREGWMERRMEEQKDA